MSSLNPGLVLDLPLNNISGGNKLLDAYSNVRGTLYGKPSLIPDDIFGSCLNFDGVDDYVSIDGDLNITGNSPRSIFCWVKYTSVSTDNNLYAFISTGTAINFQAFNLVKYSSTVGVMGYDYDHYPSSGANINNGKWHYIGCTYDGTTLKIYVDALLVSQIARGSYNTTGSNNYIGKSNHVGYERYFKGQISQVRIFNRALSSREIEEDRQNDIKGLVLYLDFNYISSNKIIDDSGNVRGTLYGNTKLVPDESFGTCLRLDGKDDYVNTGASFPNIKDTFTIEGCVWPESDHQIDPELSEVFGGVGGQKFMLWPNHGDIVYGSALGPNHAGAGISVGTNGVSVYEHAANYMPAVLVWKGSLDKWTHIAVIYQNKKPSLYINGELKKTGSAASKKIVHPSAGEAARPGSGFTGGGWGGGPYGYFDGKMANVRIYNRALTVEEIQQDMEEDRVASAAFRQTYPIAFSLSDDNDQAVIYIDDASGGEKLKLVITNTSQQELKLIELKGDVSKENHHFELRFKQGTLSKYTIESLKQKVSLSKNDNWSIRYEPQTDNTDSLYFLCNDVSNINPFKPTSNIILTLPPISAAAQGGARGTMVELRYQNINQDENIEIHGSRLQYLSIVNHQGKKNIPLYVGFVGGNTILNDGSSSNELNLRISNILKQGKINLNPEAKDNPSKFIISFDVSGNVQSDWVLGTKSQVEKIHISFGLIGILSQNANNTSELTLNQALTEIIKKNTSLTLISRDGTTQSVTVSQDASVGQRTITINEQINARKDDKIYINHRGLWKVTKNSQGQSPEWTVTLQEQDKTFLDVGEFIQLTLSKIISSTPSGHTNLYIYYENIPGYWDGQFIVTIEKAPIVYQVDRVGIGIIDPVGTLDVARGNATQGTAVFRGTTRASHFNYSTDEHTYIRGGKTSSNVYINDNGGNVGIGTTKPQGKLEIKGNDNEKVLLKVTKSDDNNLFSIQNDGKFNVNGDLNISNGSLTGSGLIGTEQIKKGAVTKDQLAISPVDIGALSKNVFFNSYIISCFIDFLQRKINEAEQKEWQSKQKVKGTGWSISPQSGSTQIKIDSQSFDDGLIIYYFPEYLNNFSLTIDKFKQEDSWTIIKLLKNSKKKEEILMRATWNDSNYSQDIAASITGDDMNMAYTRGVIILYRQ